MAQSKSTRRRAWIAGAQICAFIEQEAQQLDRRF
jgi:hypothetical protein